VRVALIRERSVFGSRGVEKMFEKIKEKAQSFFEKDTCSVLGKTYPHGASACIGDQCIQCDDGEWGPNEYEEASRKRNLGL
jgi:hypothetical protein